MIISGFLVTTTSIDNIISLRLGTFGDLLVLISTIAWATTAIIMRKYLKHLNAGIITFYRFLLASIFFIFYFSITWTMIELNIYQILIGIIVAIGTISYYFGLKRIKAAQVSGLELSAPFFAAILGFLILGEKLTIIQIFGIILLLVGIYYISKKEEIAQWKYLYKNELNISYNKAKKIITILKHRGIIKETRGKV